MTVWGISSTRDEDDIVEFSVRHMLEECDAVLIADHGSVDGTAAILSHLAAGNPRLHVTSNPTAEFDQPAIENALADTARQMGASWVVPFDTDEIWRSTAGRLRDVLPWLAGDHVIATVYEHVPTPSDEGPNPFEAMHWRCGTRWAWDKVAIRGPLQLSIGHHEAYGGSRSHTEGFEVRHFPWRSAAQARRRVQRNADHPNLTAGSLNRNYAAMSQILDDPAVFAGWWSGITSVDGAVRDPVRLRG